MSSILITFLISIIFWWVPGPVDHYPTTPIEITEESTDFVSKEIHDNNTNTPTDLASDPLITFAQCLTDAGLEMYWASWCSHCKDQKEAFGILAFDRINYIECTKEEEKCEAAEVRWYPTWIGPNYRKAWVNSFQELEDASGCKYTG